MNLIRRRCARQNLGDAVWQFSVVAAMLAIALLSDQADAVLLDSTSPPVIAEFNDLTLTTNPGCAGFNLTTCVTYVGLANGTFRIEIFDNVSGALLFETPQPIEAGALRNSLSMSPNLPTMGPSFRGRLKITVLAGAFDLDRLAMTVTTNNPPGPGSTIAYYSQTIVFPRDTPDIVDSRFSQDVYVRNGAPNTNEGASAFLQVAAAGENRALISFTESIFDFVARQDRPIASAILNLTTVENGNNWGRDGRTIDIHRVTEDWDEGNGRDAGYSRAESLRGDKPGATWDCASDSNTTNFRPDCSGDTAWEMGRPNRLDLHPWAVDPTDTVLITNGLIGDIEFDVTADVQAFLEGGPNYGWIIMKTEEHLPGRIDFASRESGLGARLVITYGP